MKTLASSGRQLQEDALKIVALSKTDIEDCNRKINTTSLIVGAGSIASILIFSLIILRAVTRPMANTITMPKSIAEGEGDLTKHLDISIANVRVINRRSTGSAPLGALTYHHNKDR